MTAKAAGLLSLAAWVLWASLNCFGQSTTAQITGRISDQSGAVIPAAAVTVINEETGVRRQAESNDLGQYSAPLLPPGTYRVTVQKQGFKPVTRTGITLQVDQTAHVIIYDRPSIRPHPARAGGHLRNPFAGNVLPSPLLDPVGSKPARCYPAFNMAGDPLTETRNYVSNALQEID